MDLHGLEVGPQFSALVGGAMGACLIESGVCLGSAGENRSKKKGARGIFFLTCDLQYITHCIQH